MSLVDRMSRNLAWIADRDNRLRKREERVILREQRREEAARRLEAAERIVVMERPSQSVEDVIAMQARYGIREWDGGI